MTTWGTPLVAVVSAGKVRKVGRYIYRTPRPIHGAGTSTEAARTIQQVSPPYGHMLRPGIVGEYGPTHQVLYAFDHHEGN